MHEVVQMIVCIYEQRRDVIGSDIHEDVRVKKIVKGRASSGPTREVESGKVVVVDEGAGVDECDTL